MTNGYNIGFVEEYGSIKVYLEPMCGHELHRKKIGYLEEDNSTFHCIDSDLMTLEVMDAIVNRWNIYIESLCKKIEL